MATRRICIFTAHLNQHISPLFEKLNENPSVELKVISIFSHGLAEFWDDNFAAHIKCTIPSAGKYPLTILKPDEKSNRYTFRNINSPRLMEEVLKFDPHYVWCFGYNSLAACKLAFYPFRKYKFCFSGDSSLKQQRPFLISLLKKIVLGLFFSKVDLIFSIGEQNERYYKHYGVPKSRIVRAGLPVDIEFLLAGAKEKENSREAVRKELKFSDDIFLIGFSGKLIPIKRPLDIIDLVNELQKRGENVGAVIVGSGPMRSEVEQKIQNLGLESRVKVVGFINQDRIGRYLNAIDTLCMPSSMEPYGMSIIEAECFGKPILASDQVGCVGENDMARPDVNTLVFESGNLEMLAQQAIRLIKDRELYAKMGGESLRLSRYIAPENIAQIVDKALFSE